MYSVVLQCDVLHLPLCEGSDKIPEGRASTYILHLSVFDAINLLFLLPGPNFNVTVGPNGSGKSSIVTALSICLGGDIKSLNRQSDIQSLVNHDTQNPTAEVEIELFFNKSENLVVRTVFGREQGSQTWMANGKAKSRQVRIIFLFVRCSFL